jgi:transcriptional regulator with GAF, ATPase, and Fis domain
MRNEKLDELKKKVVLFEQRELLLNKVGSNIVSAIDLDNFLKAMVKELGKMMGVGRCDLMVYSEDMTPKINYEYRSKTDLPSSLNIVVPADNRKLADFFQSTKQPILIGDTTSGTYPEVFRNLLMKLETLSVLIIPIFFQDQLLGILGLHHCEDHYTWSKDEINFLQSLASQLAIAFQYTRLYQEKQKEVEVAKTLLEIAKDLNSKLDIDEVFSFITKKSLELMKADRCGIGLVDHEKELIDFPMGSEVAEKGGHTFDLPSILFESIQGLKDIFRRPRVIRLENPDENELSGYLLTDVFQGSSGLLAPVRVDEKVFAVLILVWNSQDKRLSSDEVRLMEGIMNQTAIAIENNKLSSEVVRLRQELKGRQARERTIGKNPKFRQCVDMTLHVSGGTTTVLVLGESGTGKELIANLIHENSQRAEGPYVKINCGAIPETLLESELFGHEAGAFTDARKQHRGKFEQANGGTIFLDEVGEMSLSAQVKLLRVLQDGEFQRVGGSKTIKTDVRVIAASNVSLEEAAAGGIFRKDLFYRLNVYPIELPPLRDRQEDLPLLVSHFIEIFREKSGKYIVGISDEAVELLRAYHWPGNVRELENAIERAVVVAERRILSVEDLPEAVRRSDKSLREKSIEIEIGASMDEIERKVITETLQFSGGIKSKAAEILGIGRRTLYRKLARFGGDRA